MANESGMQRFLGKTVIVTGSASGIGRGVAERFSSEGANVVLCDIDEPKLEAVAQALTAERTFAMRCDVSEFAEVQSLGPPVQG
jgi:meso-butanediol dehydrogenase/(S,S)-butanediol dehydrogenase/diacetyl reductase